MAELAFESMSVALESTRGTLVTPPTHILNMKGMITPMEDVFDPDDQLGVLAGQTREEIVGKHGEWEAEGSADVTKLPVLFNMALAPVTTGVVPGRPVLSIAVTAGGSGYSGTITAAITGGGGVGATATVTRTGDAASAVTVVNGGQYYTTAPTVTLSGDGTGATATATLVTAPSTAKIWEFVRVMTAQTLKTGTFYWGDPNQKMYQGAYGFVDNMSFDADASGTDDVKMSVSGATQYPDDIASPTLPALSLGPLLMPRRMQLWMDSSLAIGATAITGRLVSANMDIPTGVTPKNLATGPTGGLGYDHLGMAKVTPEMHLVFEMVDQTQYLLFKAGTDMKIRIRFNGAVIEGVFYNYLEFDIYGKLRDLSWGEMEGTNRTVEFTVRGNYNAGPASDLVARVMNSSATL